MIPLVELAPGYSVPRIILGGWQLSVGHSAETIDREAIFAIWDRALDSGLNTLDCADIYTGVEALIGSYVRRRRAAGVALPQVHTKLVPDLAVLPTIDRRLVERIVDRSLTRLGLERLDLVQFHWWDYAIPRYLEVLGWLADLVRDGKIRLLGLTNFDADRTRELISLGESIASTQVQYSLLDQRPARSLDRLARANRLGILCYGSLAGGFLNERWLGEAEPANLGNRSLIKYRLMIDEFGGWAAYQALLSQIDLVAKQRRATIPEVAISWVLGRPAVAAVIVGLRSADHLAGLARTARLTLSRADRESLDEAAPAGSSPPGEVYQAERVAGGRHAAIIRSDLNALAVDL